MIIINNKKYQNPLLVFALEVEAQTYLAERNALLTFINNKGLLNEFYGKK